MKIAISGKGGVGKTTLTALLARVFVEAGDKVLVVDADPDANLAATLGFPDPYGIVPISQMKDLIMERTEASVAGVGMFFKLNPKVDDLPERFCVEHNGVKLMIMGTIKDGGTGCYCPENVLLRRLMGHLLLEREEVVILDMEAGIEHLGRSTAETVDKLIIVVEPSRRSCETAYRIRDLASDIGVENIAVVGNKVRDKKEKDFLVDTMPDFEFLGFIPYEKKVVQADMANLPLSGAAQNIFEETREIARRIKKGVGA